MKKAERQQKFHEVFTKIFFPPQPPPPSPPLPSKVEDEPIDTTCEGFDANLDLDANDSGERNSSGDTSECVTPKPTRAQRKRVRKRKLKEVASHRRKIIGPLLPSTDEDSIGEPFIQEEKPDCQKC